MAARRTPRTAAKIILPKAVIMTKRVKLKICVTTSLTAPQSLMILNGQTRIKEKTDRVTHLMKTLEQKAKKPGLQAVAKPAAV